MTKIKLLAIFITAMIATGLVVSCASQDPKRPEGKVSRPFEYYGYTFPEYEGYTKRSEYIEMSDGVKLAADIYLPADGPPGDSFPVILMQTPYHRAMVLPDPKLWQKLGAMLVVGSPGPVFGVQDIAEMPHILLSHGYAFMLAEFRGTGASYGWKIDYMPRFFEDTTELIDWITEQSWCDGNIGMFGESYLGSATLYGASGKNPALKCIFPEVGAFEGYSSEVYPGGIYQHYKMTEMAQMFADHTKNYFELDVPRLLKTRDPMLGGFSLPAAPVIDEDGDGDLFDEIPMDLNGNGFFIDDYDYPDDPSDPPRYKDGQAREHIYYMATLDHQQNVDVVSWTMDAYFIDGDVDEDLFPHEARDEFRNLNICLI